MKTRTLIIVVCLILTSHSKVVWGQDRPADLTNARHLTERDDKAAFLVNFARLTEWPDSPLASASSPFVIGVAGDEGLRHSVDHVIRNEVVNRRALRTRKVWDAGRSKW